MARYEDEEPNDTHIREVPSFWCQAIRTSSKGRVLLVLLLGVIVGLAVPAILDTYLWRKDKFTRPECQLPPNFRLNALSRFGSTEKWTKQRLQEMCFNETGCNMTAEDIHVPPCYHPHPANYYYEVTQTEECNEGNKTDFTIHAKMKEPTNSERKDQVKKLRMRVDEMEDHRVIIRVFNDEVTNYFTPYEYLSYSGRRKNDVRCNRPGRLYNIDHKPKIGGRLFVDVKRKDEGKGERSIFNTDFGALISEDQYFELTIVLPSNNIYGLGQGRHTTLRHNMKNTTSWSLFAGQDSGWGHGVHPFYLCLEEDGKAHGVLLEHSNALEITLQEVPSITYKSIGSNFLFHILMGPTPEDVIRQLAQLVGLPEMPPYWALGHHICRGNSKTAQETVNKLREKKVPQESDCYSDSLLLNGDWKDVTEFADNLRNHTQKILLVHVPHVAEDVADNTSSSYVWMNNPKKENVVGMLNSNKVLYPDYFQDLRMWTTDQMNKVLSSSNTTFDGYLLTNNTPVDEREITRICSASELNNPTFLTGKNNLWSNTLCMDTCHGRSTKLQSCKKSNEKNHYNLHNLYGYRHSKTMFQTVTNLKDYKDKKIFLASLSTFTGSGKFGGQFSTGFSASWTDMKVALVQMLEFNLFGIPMTGAPICGYHFRKDRDLCSSWTKLGAFQPFLISYHHNNDDNSFLTPTFMDDFVGSIAAASFQLRYSLLPYLYTLFYHASVTGTPVMRPLFYEFPKDPQTRGIDEQFLWGPAVMISPIMKNSIRQFSAYFPEGIWYNYHNGDIIHQGDHGAYKNLTALEYYINIHVRGGHILAVQKQGLYTEDVRKSPYKLRVALDRIAEGKHEYAKGVLYIDDGISKTGPALNVSMLVLKTTLTLTPNFIRGNKADFLQGFPYSLEVDSIYIFGLTSSTAQYSCKVNNQDVPCRPDEEHGTLTFRNVTSKINLTENNTITWQ